MKKVKDHVSVKHLAPQKDMARLEYGEGCIFTQDGGTTAFYNNGDAMRFLGFIEMLPNTKRVQHYHNKKTENFFVAKGEVLLTCWLADTPDDKIEVELATGDIATILPGCCHWYTTVIGATCLEFSPTKFALDDFIATN